MLRRRRSTSALSRLGLLLIVPVAVSGGAYAVFSQKLTMSGTGKDVTYVSSQNMVATYTKTITGQGASSLYNLATTIKNNGALGVEGWQFKFDVPADTAQLNCPTTVTCSRAGNTVTVVSGAGNGAIAAGGSTNFTFSFVTTNARYTLQNLYISGVYSSVMQDISGLTATIVRGNSFKQKNLWGWRPVITVTNNSNYTLSGWQVVVTPWISVYSVASAMPVGVSFTATSAGLTFTGTVELAKGASYQLNTTLMTDNNNSWTPAVTVQGRF